MIQRPILNLERLEEGYMSLSRRKSAAHGEASFYCLDSQNHKTGINLQIEGSFTEIYCLEWPYNMTEQVIRTWRENNEATDEGACGIAFLLITDLTDYDDISRAWHTTGFDYYLSYQAAVEPFEAAAKLEVSGIRAAKNDSEIKQRVKQKLAQTDVSDGDALPTYVIVVEFSRPVAQVVRK